MGLTLEHLDVVLVVESDLLCAQRILLGVQLRDLRFDAVAVVPGVMRQRVALRLEGVDLIPALRVLFAQSLLLRVVALLQRRAAGVVLLVLPLARVVLFLALLVLACLLCLPRFPLGLLRRLLRLPGARTLRRCLTRTSRSRKRNLDSSIDGTSVDRRNNSVTEQ